MSLLKVILLSCIILFTSCTAMEMSREPLNNSITSTCSRLGAVDETLADDAYTALYGARNMGVGEAEAYIACRHILNLLIVDYLKSARIVCTEGELFVKLYQCRDILRAFDEENSEALCYLRTSALKK